MNANNGIPFYPDPNLFRIRVGNGEIKESRLNELKLKIVFFGKIAFNGKTYYKYACYNHNGKIQYLELMISSAKGTQQGINKTTLLPLLLERGAPPNSSKLTFSSTRNKRQEIQVNLPQNIRRVKQNFRNIGQQLVVGKINKKNINNNTDLSEILGHFSFIEDPNGINLSELEKKRDFPFKIIRKSSLFPVRVGEPIILFGEIKINGKTYYQYCCYKSSGIGSKNGVSFRKLSNNSNDLNKFSNKNKTMYNRNALLFHPINQNRTSIKQRTYLYFIGINDVERELLENLFEFIKDERSSERKKSLFTTIYDQLNPVVGNNSEQNFELQEMKQPNIAFNVKSNIFYKEESDKHIKLELFNRTFFTPFFGKMQIDGQKYYRYACYIFENNIHFITLQLFDRNKIKVVKIDRGNVNYDLNGLFQELFQQLTSLQRSRSQISEKYFIDCKKSILEMCRLLNIPVPNNGIGNNNL